MNWLLIKTFNSFNNLRTSFWSEIIFGKFCLILNKVFCKAVAVSTNLKEVFKNDFNLVTAEFFNFSFLSIEVSVVVGSLG